MTTERRRSDRLMLTLPLLVHGQDECGDSFECEAQTIDVNRHGARIRIARFLHSGQTLKVVNKLNRREGMFRVAGPLAPLTEKGGEFGFTGPIALDTQEKIEVGREILDLNVSLWGIRFPPMSEDRESNPKALLACRQCQSAEMVRITLIELDVLETSGILARHCLACQSTTPWGYAENELAGADPSAAAPAAESASKQERRKSRRMVLQLPILIRDYFGGVEIAKSENVSKGGVCFASEKIYQIGEGIMIACPYDKAGHNIEVAAHIVNRRDVEGTNRRIYGIRYKRKP